MANLGDSDLSERGRVLFLAVVTSGAIVLTTAAFALADEWRLFQWFSRQWWPINLAFHIVLWGAVMFAISRARSVWRNAAALGSWVWIALVWLASALLRNVFRAFLWLLSVCWKLPGILVRSLLGARYQSLLTDVRLLVDPWLSPLARLYENGIEPLPRRLSDLSASWRLERELRRAYREEFREHYASYRAFRAAFLEGQASEQRGAASPPDLFAGACAALGLPGDGAFTPEAFKARYRALMKVSHPDVAGNDNQAAAINAAADIIKTRKGWQ